MRGLALVVLAGCATAAPRAEPDRLAWWQDARYGMFIHWGVYAVPAGEHGGRVYGGASEWLMHTARIPVAEYEPYAARFNPARFDARAWARLAKAAGMKYVVITSKHHDGFAMYDTAVNGWSIAKATPYARDPLVELAAACRAEGLRFGLYYSILDWHEPSQKGAGKATYVAAMKRQLAEIAARFDPDVLWFDGEWEDWWTPADGRDLAAFVRSIAPRAVVNNRVGKRGGTDGDYETPEQEIPRAGYARPWETCMTTNNSWGFHKADRAWKSPREIVRALAEIAGKGGNFLLNVGPTAEGVVPAECASRLEEVGRWLAVNGEAVYGTRGFWADRWGAITRKGRRLYVILTERPSGPVRLPIVTPLRRARLLDGRDAKVDGASLVVPELPDALAWVVALDFDEEPAREKTRAERTADGEPIPADADGSIELWAADAKLHGGTIRVEHQHPRGNAGFWTARDDFIEWFVDARGEYDVVLTYAVVPGAGGDFVMRIGDASVVGTVSSTGGWASFKTVTLGKVALAGRASVSVRPVKFTHALMNLACVKLVSRTP